MEGQLTAKLAKSGDNRYTEKQYVEAKMKLEDQLLKLKEEREDLKERGNRHEDKIMRENAKLQVNIALLAITLFFLPSMF